MCHHNNNQIGRETQRMSESSSRTVGGRRGKEDEADNGKRRDAKKGHGMAQVPSFIRVLFNQSLRTRNLARVSHGGILFLETQVHAFRGLDELVEAPVDAACFARGEGFGGEVKHAVFEAALDNCGIDLWRVKDALVSHLYPILISLA